MGAHTSSCQSKKYLAKKMRKKKTKWQIKNLNILDKYLVTNIMSARIFCKISSYKYHVCEDMGAHTSSRRSNDKQHEILRDLLNTNTNTNANTKGTPAR